MDYKMFRSIYRLAYQYPSLNKWMIFLSNNVRYLFGFALIIMWFRDRSCKNITFNAILSSLFALMTNSMIKGFYFKPRPFMTHQVDILIHSKNDSSFPSKHTLLVFAVATSIILGKRIIGSIMWLLACLTGFSRIWVGHHYPSDIIGSAMIGSLISVVSNKFTKRI